MQIRRVLHKTVRALPSGVRHALPPAVSRYRPWEPDANLRPPDCPPGWSTGPPDFVGVGAQKAGTTWWLSLLLQHPGVHHPSGVHKEHHFFGPYWRRPFGPDDVQRYHRWFPRPPGTQVGEWTPEYLLHFWTAPLLAAAAPEARLLVLLRDPVDRYRSGITFELGRGSRAYPVIGVEAFARGQYFEQLSRMERHFPRERILVLQYEACIRDVPGQFARTLRFLGLDDGFAPRTPDRKLNATRAAKLALPDGLVTQLRALYSPDVSRLAAAYPEVDLSLWPNFADLR